MNERIQSQHSLDRLTTRSLTGSRARSTMTRSSAGIAGVAVALALALGARVPAAAQTPPDTFRLGEIVVTATRSPLPRAAVPAAVTVIDGESLRQRGIHHVEEALRAVPGIALARSGSSGAFLSLFMRGGESNYVRVLVDGVAINEPGGGVDVSQIAAAEVERIEIVRGPTSVLYGSDAVSGVIQIFTRPGSAGAPRVEASVAAGLSERLGPAIDLDGQIGEEQVGESSAAVDWSASVTGGAGPVEYSAGIARHDDQGAYAINNRYDRIAANASIGVAAAGFEVDAHARYADGRYHFPTNSSGAFVDANQFSDSESTLFGLEARRGFGQRAAAALRVTSHAFDRVTDDAQDSPDDLQGTYASNNATHSDRLGAELQLDLLLTGSSTLTLGGAAERQEVETSFTSESEFGPFESASINERDTRGVFAQLVTQPAGALTLTGGARVEDNERFGTFATWRAGANLRAGSTLLRAAAGTAFKEPTFFENYAEGFVRGNPDLDPERSFSWEVGVERRIGATAVLGATYFDQRFRDMIQFFGAAPPDEPNYVNVAAARTRGIEVTASVRAGAVTLEGGYAYIDAEATDAGDEADLTFLAGQPLLRRPRHSGSAAVTIDATSRLDIGASVNVVGDRDDVAFHPDFTSERVVLPAYATVGVSAEYELLRADTRRLALTFRIYNALDERYSEAYGFHAPARAIWLGLRGAM